MLSRKAVNECVSAEVIPRKADFPVMNNRQSTMLLNVLLLRR